MNSPTQLLKKDSILCFLLGALSVYALVQQLNQGPISNAAWVIRAIGLVLLGISYIRSGKAMVLPLGLLVLAHGLALGIAIPGLLTNGDYLALVQQGLPLVALGGVLLQCWKPQLLPLVALPALAAVGQLVFLLSQGSEQLGQGDPTMNILPLATVWCYSGL